MSNRPPLTAIIGGTIVLVLVLGALLAPWIAPYGEREMVGGVWEPVSAAHWLGTDNIGRDMLTRILYGGRNTIGIAVVITFIAFGLGVTFGFLSSAIGGWVDNVLSRIVDIILSLPALVSALMVLSLFGTSLPVLILTIGIIEATRVYIVSRAVARTITVLDYITVARLRGEGMGWVLMREVLPNALPPLIAEAGLRFCYVFLFIASLSFLGLGLQPPAPDWGSMVRENGQAINFGFFAPLYPAIAIAMMTVGVNLVVDWLLSLHSRPGGHAIEV